MSSVSYSRAWVTGKNEIMKGVYFNCFCREFLRKEINIIFPFYFYIFTSRGSTVKISQTVILKRLKRVNFH
jgi:hypothetical protein